MFQLLFHVHSAQLLCFQIDIGLYLNHYGKMVQTVEVESLRSLYVVTVTWGNLGRNQFPEYCTRSFRTGGASHSQVLLLYCICTTYTFICEENWCVHTNTVGTLLVFADSLYTIRLAFVVPAELSG